MREQRVVEREDDEELCARCGDPMRIGSTVVDVDTEDDMRWATAEWATIHETCDTNREGKE